ncbi:hypothetical protein BH24DEI2_BH24DEI2_09250 [soil metagenome]
MTVDDWVLEAVAQHGKAGATVRDVQRYIDEHHFEELAVDTIENALDKLLGAGTVTQGGDKWHAVRRTSKEDALKKLFKDE